MKAYDYRHTVMFDETNVVGNVYFAHYFHWQGRCREDFLRRHAPGILGELAAGLCLVTTDSHCTFLSELFPFDEVLIEMTLTRLRKRRARMTYRYFRMTPEGRQLVAMGEQGVACMRKTKHGDVVPEPFPEELYTALALYKEKKLPKDRETSITGVAQLSPAPPRGDSIMITQ